MTIPCSIYEDPDLVKFFRSAEEIECMKREVRQVVADSQDPPLIIEGEYVRVDAEILCIGADDGAEN